MKQRFWVACLELYDCPKSSSLIFSTPLYPFFTFFFKFFYKELFIFSLNLLLLPTLLIYFVPTITHHSLNCFPYCCLHFCAKFLKSGNFPATLIFLITPSSVHKKLIPLNIIILHPHTHFFPIFIVYF